MKEKFKKPKRTLLIEDWFDVLKIRLLLLEFSQHSVKVSSKISATEPLMCVQGRRVFRPSASNRSCVWLPKTVVGLEKGQKAARFEQGFGHTFGNQRCLQQELQKQIKKFNEVQEDGLVRHLIMCSEIDGTLEINRGVWEGTMDW